MDRFDRIFELHRLLSGARMPVPRATIEAQLECSRATANRIIQAMRLYLNAPITFDRTRDGYFYDTSAAEGGMYELPGIWFNASELHALLVMKELLQRAEPGLFDRWLSPLAGQIDKLLSAKHANGDDVARRVRILGMAHRPAGQWFDRVAGATLQRQRLHIHYLGRQADRAAEREISPQRLIHYRGNWYLDAWCHCRDALRIFAIEQMIHVRALDTPALDVPDAALDAHYTEAYGIFAGPATQTARLYFTPSRARWVAQEQWHPKQQGHQLPDGGYQLCIPYGNPAELVMDILRHGPEVQVLGPASLRDEVVKQLGAALDHYN